MNIIDQPPYNETPAWTAAVMPQVQAAHDIQAAAPPGTDLDQCLPFPRAGERADAVTVASDAAPSHEPFIVICPGCGGSGRVLRDGSQVRLACRLCWERGVVARILADRYLRNPLRVGGSGINQ